MNSYFYSWTDYRQRGKSGSVYFTARMQVYDMPHPGEPYGRIEAPVVLEKGEISDEVTITVAPFTGEYQSGMSRRPD